MYCAHSHKIINYSDVVPNRNYIQGLKTRLKNLTPTSSQQSVIEAHVIEIVTGRYKVSILDGSSPAVRWKHFLQYYYNCQCMQYCTGCEFWPNYLIPQPTLGHASRAITVL